MPLLLFTSVQDHVVQPSDSDALAATYGGSVERVMLERSYHVATQDYDKDIIFEGAVALGLWEIVIVVIGENHSPIAQSSVEIQAGKR